jgi:hypothetical protein
LGVEVLEDRTLMSIGISIGDASAIEASSTVKLLDRFVSDGSGGLSTARQSIFGPDGNLYVASADTNAILRYDGGTGAFKDAFVPSGSGGLNGPGDLVFSPANTSFPDGCLYVSSVAGGQVLRYDGVSGAFVDVVASGLSSPLGLTLRSDGSLYIANQFANDILRETSSALSASPPPTPTTFVNAGSGGLSRARKAVFGPDGNMYVASASTNQVLRYDGQTGTFIDTFATLPPNSSEGPLWLQFGSDGHLYATAETPNSTTTSRSIVRLNATTGAVVDSYILGRDGWSFNLGPGNILYDSSNSSGGFVERFGPSSLAAFTVSLNGAGSSAVTVNYATADGTALAGKDYTASSGTVTIPPGLTAQTVLIQTLDDGTADPTMGFTINLKNPSGATIARGQAFGTILDDTKFYVVDGGSTDSTFQYASGGTALGSNTLGDTAPRGVATTAAGTTDWVVDANKSVFVYSTGGALLGSWSAGGLSSAATLTGIATNGTDIWLVDSYATKVYKYAGAAGRLAGTQNPASSFSLATGKNGDSNPQDIATDGASFWVLDGTAHKVFKYTVSGSALGSWSIDPANAHPTGMTINPSNVSDVWIADSGTLKVYQYTGAAGRTSGSQSAAATFALNPSDTDPQGIADPPPADMLLAPTTGLLTPPQPYPAALDIVLSFGSSSITSAPSVDALGSSGNNHGAATSPGTVAADTLPGPSASPATDRAVCTLGVLRDTTLTAILTVTQPETAWAYRGTLVRVIAGAEPLGPDPISGGLR